MNQGHAPFVILATHSFGEIFGVTLAYSLWLGPGLWGVILLGRKGYLGWIAELGCFGLLVFGWLPVTIVFALAACLGPVWLLVGKMVPDRN